MRRSPIVLATCLALLAAGCRSATASAPAPGGPVELAGPGPLPPVVASGGAIRLDKDARPFERPRPEDETCVGRALMWQKAAVGLENRVKFAVLRDGSLARFSFERPVGPEVASAVETAFRSCSWLPGKDPRGNTLAVWVIQPIKVNAPSGSR